MEEGTIIYKVKDLIGLLIKPSIGELLSFKLPRIEENSSIRAKNPYTLTETMLPIIVPSISVDKIEKNIAPPF